LFSHFYFWITWRNYWRFHNEFTAKSIFIFLKIRDLKRIYVVIISVSKNATYEFNIILTKSFWVIFQRNLKQGLVFCFFLLIGRIFSSAEEILIHFLLPLSVLAVIFIQLKSKQFIRNDPFFDPTKRNYI